MAGAFQGTWRVGQATLVVTCDGDPYMGDPTTVTLDGIEQVITYRARMRDGGTTILRFSSAEGTKHELVFHRGLRLQGNFYESLDGQTLERT